MNEFLEHISERQRRVFRLNRVAVVREARRRHPVACVTPEAIVRAGDAWRRRQRRFLVGMAVALGIALVGLAWLGYEAARASWK